MKAEVFTFCDFSQNNQGKLTIVGCFDTIHAKVLPVVHPMLSVALRVRFSVQERGSHSFVLSFTDLEGGEVLPPFRGEMTVEDFRSSTSAFNLSLNVVNVELKKETTITAKLEIDGKEAAYSPLHVVRV